MSFASPPCSSGEHEQVSVEAAAWVVVLPAVGSALVLCGFFVVEGRGAVGAESEGSAASATPVVLFAEDDVGWAWGFFVEAGASEAESASEMVEEEEGDVEWVVVFFVALGEAELSLSSEESSSDLGVGVAL